MAEPLLPPLRTNKVHPVRAMRASCHACGQNVRQRKAKVGNRPEWQRLLTGYSDVLFEEGESNGRHF